MGESTMGSDHGQMRLEPARKVPVSGPPDDATRLSLPTFGMPVAGVTYVPRPAAYAVIRNAAGAVAAVHVPAGYWLPGGGILPGETPHNCRSGDTVKAGAFFQRCVRCQRTHWASIVVHL